jgi:hypothetical protein
MAKDVCAQKTLIQQIHEELLSSIVTLDAFDEQTLQSLTRLIEAGELKKPKKVAEAISQSAEGQHEAAGT